MAGRKLLVRVTSVFFVEQVHDLLKILRREPRVDRGRLNVGVTEMLLHRAEVAVGAAARYPKDDIRGSCA